MTTRTPVPAWLREHLIDTGAWSRDGINRRAHLQRHNCGALVLTGLDADNAAFTATVDPTPLTTLGEALALLGNRPTYDFRPRIRHLDGPRTALKIAHSPAGTARGIHVLPTHTCDTPPLPHHDDPPPTRTQDTDVCPF